MLLLVISEVLALFVNISTADRNDSLCNTKNLQQSIQMQLLLKQKALSKYFALFLKPISNFEYFFKKYDPQSLCIAEITDCE